MSLHVRRSSRLAVALSVAVLSAAGLVAAPAAHAAAGDLDPSFGSAGRVVRDFDGCDDDARAIAQQADGKLLVAGYACESDTYPPVLQRYTTAGALDPTFDGDGQVIPELEGEFGAIEAAAGGDVVVGGIVLTVDSSDALVARYSSTGAQEMVFTHHLGSENGSAYVEDLLVAEDGTITAAGSLCDSDVDDGFTCQLFVLRITAAGALDTSFDTDGVALSATGIFGDIVLLPDGRVALSGYDDQGNSVVQLYTSGLVPDESFNTTGSRTLPFDAQNVSVSPSGLLVVGTQYGEGDSGDAAAALVDLSGALVTSFGDGGIAIADLGGDEFAMLGATDSAGRVYVAGQENVDNAGYLVARLTADGELDSSFGEGGSVRTSFGNGFAIPSAILVQAADDRPVVAGQAWSDSTGFDAALVRYLASTPNQIRYTPMTPARILDSRPTSPVTNDGISRQFNAVEEFDMQVTGRGGVPATGVSAVVLNVTVISPTAGGFVSAYPSGRPRPGSSNLNFVAGQTVPNLVKVKVGDLGRVTLFNGTSGRLHLAVDVAGWYSDGTAPVTGGVYVPLSPDRVLDSRPGRAPAGDGLDAPIARTATADVTILGRGGVPATGVSAVVLNVTVVSPTAGGFLTAFPAGGGRPNASNLNYSPGQTVANLVIVKVGTGGKVSLFNGSAGTTHVLADVAGYFTDPVASLENGAFQALSPVRILDTRNAPLAKLAPGQTLTVQVAGRGRVPATGATAVALNVTAVAPTSGGFLTVYPSDAPSRPPVSNVNFPAGRNVPNAVIVKLGADGKVKLFNALGNTHVLFDVSGWYGPATELTE